MDVDANAKTEGSQRIKGLICDVCGVKGISSLSKLNLHRERMHSRPVTCLVCDVEFVDKHFYVVHKPCYCYCPVEGCIWMDQRKKRLPGHLRRKHGMVL